MGRVHSEQRGCGKPSGQGSEWASGSVEDMDFPVTLKREDVAAHLKVVADSVKVDVVADELREPLKLPAVTLSAGGQNQPCGGGAKPAT